MSIWLVAGAILSTIRLEGAVPAEGGDYLVVPFEVPAGTVELEIAHDDGSDAVILDWGVWSPEGFRGWGGGLTDPAVIGEAESSRGYLPGPITPGTWTLVIGKARLAGGPARYVADVTFRDAATLAPVPRAPFAPVVVARGARWYAGDLHVHSEESGDASARLDEIVELARQRGLDFVVVTDHNTVSHLGRLAAAQPALADLLLVRGIEVTTYRGHGNAIGVADYVDHRVGLGGVSAATITAAVAAQGGVFSVNHPALALGDVCIGCAWEHPDTPWHEVDALEIQTGPYDATGALFTPQAIARWDELLDAGHRLGAVGGSDDHRAGRGTGGTQAPIGSPTTLVWADELSEAAIVRAIREGRTVVKLRGPDDPMIELTARTAGDGTARVGDTVTGVGRARLTAHVTGGAGKALQIWRDGARLETIPIEADDWTRVFDYPVSGAAERYRAEVVDGGGRRTVTSHLWIEGDPARDGGGCACHGGGGGGAGALPAVALVLGCLGRRRRSRPEVPHAPQEGPG
jgi:hypothetical protein